MSAAPVIERLAAAGIVVPKAVNPVANYVSCLEVQGPLLFVSGQGTRRDGVFQYVGKIGGNLSIDDGYAAAWQCALNILAQVEGSCGLERIRQVVKLTGFVNAVSDFTELPAVLNGASDLMVAAFGDRGRHARSAVGVGTLPFGMAVEVEAVLSLTDPAA